jgi:hypothetical protein
VSGEILQPGRQQRRHHVEAVRGAFEVNTKRAWLTVGSTAEIEHSFNRGLGENSERDHRFREQHFASSLTREVSALMSTTALTPPIISLS